jgi:hypothetical protein
MISPTGFRLNAHNLVLDSDGLGEPLICNQLVLRFELIGHRVLETMPEVEQLCVLGHASPKRICETVEVRTGSVGPASAAVSLVRTLGSSQGPCVSLRALHLSRKVDSLNLGHCLASGG